MPNPSVSERTFYAPLIEVIKEYGGKGVQEVQYNSVPDIEFEFAQRRWILSVKIGDSAKIIKEAFIQYTRHKRESGLADGIILFFPETVRRTKATSDDVLSVARNTPSTILIDSASIKQDFTNKSFAEVIEFLHGDFQAQVALRRRSYYSMARVIGMLQLQVKELMAAIPITEERLIAIITDPALLRGLGNLGQSEALPVGRFLAAYIFLSQVMFLRLLSQTRPNWLPLPPKSGVNHHFLRQAFEQVLDINYKPIYELDVLDAIDEKYLRDTFDLIWGLAIEEVKHELPGRIFHELMPHEIRKMMAAFYTRPIAADLLSSLTLTDATETVFDLACGSGTILAAAYKRKAELYRRSGLGNPHKRFCESELFGADIMPFAVHLTSANLAAMDPATGIERTQIIQGDSLQLDVSEHRIGGLKLPFFPRNRRTTQAKKTSGDPYDIALQQVDAVLMNPPFTKIERGIQRYVDLSRFRSVVRGDIGLWGHFIALADHFLKDGGILGAVIPISILRGSETEEVRRLLFSDFTPLYVIKSTLNYGFSEWSEYRDILFIARKGEMPNDHKVKFCLVKKDLTSLTSEDISQITETVRRDEDSETTLVDTLHVLVTEIEERITNLMWFCGASSLENRRVLSTFAEKASERLARPKITFVKTRIRTSGGSAKHLLITRPITSERVEKAYLRLHSEEEWQIEAHSPLGVGYVIDRSALTRSLRTPVGISTMSIDGTWDYLTIRPHRDLRRICTAACTLVPTQLHWETLRRSAESVSSHLLIARRINPFSPAQVNVAFYSKEKLSPTDQFNVVVSADDDEAMALCVILNSIIFYSQFFLLKEDTTGRYIDLRLYDYREMQLIPNNKFYPALVEVFQKFGDISFPSLSHQLDSDFHLRYDEYTSDENTPKLFDIQESPVRPARERITFDLAVCAALKIPVTESELVRVYAKIVDEMLITKGLARD